MPFPLADIDDATTFLLAQLSLEDIDNTKMAQKAKRRETAAPTDEEVALQLQSEYLRHHLACLEDITFAKSLQTAMTTDTSCFEAMRIVEQAALEDHQYALALSRGEELPEQSEAQRRLEDADFHEIEETEEIEENEAIETISRTETSFASSSSSRLTACKSNVSCGDLITTRMRLRAPCKHDYCQNCLQDLVKASLGDESLFPLRYCKTAFPVRDILPLLHRVLQAQFHAKSLEFGTPAMQRLYCPNATCSIFLGAAGSMTDVFRCTSCRTHICTKCKQIAHPNERWGENAALLEVQALARDKHWQTCPGCNAIIELDAEFCYVCGVRWKNCECPQWDEERLVNAAEERENVIAGALRRVNPIEYQQRVQARVVELRENHDCAYHSWREGMEVCSRCGVAACVRCSRNRL
ncbi:hypothetical protein C8J56DRAFT_1004383 [Mycena floridula]|nr:hypothetical protein C8J56DRAFT_1004383 [Mycena floridula]